MLRIHRLLLAVTIVAGLAWPAAAQTISQSDIQRLHEDAAQAARSVQQVRGRDEMLGQQLRTQLDDLEDEIIYLKVKLRKENTLSRAEYADVRDRIGDVRTRASNEYARLTAPPPPPAPRNDPPINAARTTPSRNAIEIPVGTELDVRTQSALNSGTAMVEDRFEATTMADVVIDGRTAIPAGAVMRGVVTAVDSAGRLNRKAQMTVSFDQVTFNNRSYPMRGMVTQVLEGEGYKGDAVKIGAGAGVGAILGGILGGGKGALAGVLIGGGGTIAATEGKEIDLPQGSVLRVRLDSPLQVGGSLR